MQQDILLWFAVICPRRNRQLNTYSKMSIVRHKIAGVNSPYGSIINKVGLRSKLMEKAGTKTGANSQISNYLWTLIIHTQCIHHFVPRSQIYIFNPIYLPCDCPSVCGRFGCLPLLLFHWRDWVPQFQANRIMTVMRLGTFQWTATLLQVFVVYNDKVLLCMCYYNIERFFQLHCT